MRALIVGNGWMPRLPLISEACADSDYVIAADGGANALWQARLQCDVILGDLDSILPDVFPGVPRIAAGDQDYTDLDKAIAFALERSAKAIMMTAVTGDRLDHTFEALCMLVKYGRRSNISLLDETGVARLVNGCLTLPHIAGRTISLLPLTLATGVTTSGLHWDLLSETLSAGIRESISNLALNDCVSVTVGDGDLVVYTHHP
jgi:thiamine pyrophosphokinase